MRQSTRSYRVLGIKFVFNQQQKEYCQHITLGMVGEDEAYFSVIFSSTR